MIIPFVDQPPTARVWLYQANRNLVDSEIQYITHFLNPALEQWAAHGAGLQASFYIFEKRVVTIALNENVNQASGCSIDASTRWFQEIGSNLKIDFFDRSLCFWNNGWQEVSAFGIKKVVEEGLINPETKIINTTITTKAEVETSLIIEAGQSWLQKYFITKHG